MPPYISSDAMIWIAAFGPPLTICLVAFTANHVVGLLSGTGAQS